MPVPNLFEPSALPPKSKTTPLTISSEIDVAMICSNRRPERISQPSGGAPLPAVRSSNSLPTPGRAQPLCPGATRRRQSGLAWRASVQDTPAARFLSCSQHLSLQQGKGCRRSRSKSQRLCSAWTCLVSWRVLDVLTRRSVGNVVNMKVPRSWVGIGSRNLRTTNIGIFGSSSCEQKRFGIYTGLF